MRRIPWIILGIILGISAPALAFSLSADCSVTNLSFVIGGQSVTPQANGLPAGFICSGTTYVPLRFVAQSLGQTVSWDGTTHTITLTSPTPAAAGSTLSYQDVGSTSFAPQTIDVTLSQVQTEATVSNPTNAFETATAPTGYRYVVVTLTLKNTGTDSVTLSPDLESYLQDSQGHRYTPDFISSTALVDDISAGGDLAPDQSLTGEISYEVPTSSSGLQLWWGNNGSYATFTLGQ